MHVTSLRYSRCHAVSFFRKLKISNARSFEPHIAEELENGSEERENMVPAIHFTPAMSIEARERFFRRDLDTFPNPIPSYADGSENRNSEGYAFTIGIIMFSHRYRNSASVYTTKLQVVSHC